MNKYRKSTTEQKMQKMLADQRITLPPLSIQCIEQQPTVENGRKLDALVEVTWGQQSTLFAVELRARFTPKAFEAAVNQLKAVALPTGTLPMVLLPYLSEARLEELAREGISGIDLCGNGVVMVPNRLFVWRTGERNRFTTSAPIKNIYRKNSSMVPRVFLARPRFERVSEVLTEINSRNFLVSELGRTAMVLGTVSKALKAMDDDLIISRERGSIRLVQPDKLLAMLLEHYPSEKPVATRVRISLALSVLPERLADLSKELSLPIIATGLGSVNRYAVMQRGEMVSVYCPRPETLLSQLPVAESDRFANLEIVATEDETLYFDGRRDEESAFRWAAPVQTYLELMRGDKRDQETAAQIREKLLQELGGTS